MMVTARKAQEMASETIDWRITDLAETVETLTEQREAALALHSGKHYCGDESGGSNLYYPSDANYPCPTARALGVTD